MKMIVPINQRRAITMCTLLLVVFMSSITLVHCENQCTGISVYICNGTLLQEFPDLSTASFATAFEFYGNNFSSLPSEIFDSPVVKRIIINNLNPFSVDDGAFKKAKHSLIKLVLGPITYEFDGLFLPVANLEKLSYLEIWNNMVNSGRVLKDRLVKDEWLPHLETLVIPSSGISDIKEKVLPEQIKSLNLKNNSLTEIPIGVEEIMDLNGITSLNLDQNKFRKLKKIWFPRKCSLDELSVEDNSLQCIQSDALTSCKYLRKLYLSGNPYLQRIGPYNLNLYYTKSLDLRIGRTGITSLNFLQGLFRRKRPLSVFWEGSRLACDCSMKLYMEYKEREAFPNLTGRCVWEDERKYSLNSKLLKKLWKLNGCKEPLPIESTDACQKLAKLPPTSESTLSFDNKRGAGIWNGKDPLTKDYTTTSLMASYTLNTSSSSSYMTELWWFMDAKKAKITTFSPESVAANVVEKSDSSLTRGKQREDDVEAAKRTRKQPVVIKTYDSGHALRMSWILQTCALTSAVFAISNIVGCYNVLQHTVPPLAQLVA